MNPEIFQNRWFVWAIVVIIIIVVVVVGYSQFVAVSIEQQDGDSQSPSESRNSENDLLDDKGDGNSGENVNHNEAVQAFCEEKFPDALGNSNAALLGQMDNDAKLESAVACATMARMGQPVFVMNWDETDTKIENSHEVSGMEYRGSPQITLIDIENDGVSELLITGGTWGGTCAPHAKLAYVYKHSGQELFSKIISWSTNGADASCGQPEKSVRYSNNARDNLAIRSALDQALPDYDANENANSESQAASSGAWNIHRDEKYKFEISYPSTINISGRDVSLYFSSNQNSSIPGPYFLIATIDPSKPETYTDATYPYLSITPNGCNQIGGITKPTVQIINGISMQRWDIDNPNAPYPFPGIRAVLQFPGKFDNIPDKYDGDIGGLCNQISIASTGLGSAEKENATWEAILASFKFIP